MILNLKYLQENPIDYKGLAKTMYNAYDKSVSLNTQNQETLSWEEQTEEVKIAWISVAKVAYSETVIYINGLFSK